MYGIIIHLSSDQKDDAIVGDSINKYGQWVIFHDVHPLTCNTKLSLIKKIRNFYESWECLPQYKNYQAAISPIPFAFNLAMIHHLND